MKKRFWLNKRRGIFYLVDSLTGAKESLKTRSRQQALEIQVMRNQAVAQPSLNLALGKAFLSAHDQQMPKRTWGAVMDEFCRHGKPTTQERSRRAVSSKALRFLRDRKVVETTADDFLAVINAGSVSASHFLRRLHNLALGLGWLPWPVLQKAMWPKLKPTQKRGITEEEHQKLIAAERNPEWKVYLEILWEIGAAQTDAANLCAENVDWGDLTLSYQRQKTGEWAHIRIGEGLASLLKELPRAGLLFPKIAPFNDSRRAWHFSRVCARAGVEKGVTLHSYRYAWAERARTAGYPERWAQAALGHNSRAVHQAYAKKAAVICPPLEEYEKGIVPFPEKAAVG